MSQAFIIFLIQSKLFLIIFNNFYKRTRPTCPWSNQPKFARVLVVLLSREESVATTNLSKKKKRCNWIKFFIASILKKFVTINRWIIHASFYRSWKGFVDGILRPRFRLEKYKGKFALENLNRVGIVCFNHRYPPEYRGSQVLEDFFEIWSNRRNLRCVPREEYSSRFSGRKQALHRPSRHFHKLATRKWRSRWLENLDRNC